MATESVVTPLSTAQRGDAKFRAARAQGGELQVFKYVSDSVSAGGNTTLNLSTSWVWDYAVLHHIVVKASASTDFDFEIYPDDDFTANTHIYKNENNNLVMNDRPIGGLAYVDTDETRELHLKIVNTDSGNASTFSIWLYFSPVSN